MVGTRQNAAMVLSDMTRISKGMRRRWSSRAKFRSCDAARRREGRDQGNAKMSSEALRSNNSTVGSSAPSRLCGIAQKGNHARKKAARALAHIAAGGENNQNMVETLVESSYFGLLKPDHGREVQSMAAGALAITRENRATICNLRCGASNH